MLLTLGLDKVKFSCYNRIDSNIYMYYVHNNIYTIGGLMCAETCTEYCSECSDYVELTQYGEKKCSVCNPQYMQEDDLQELDFNAELYDREGE